MKASATEVRRRLRAEADPEKAAFLPRFFKTGPGEYGEGDRFYGVTVPKCRAIARAARDIAEGELQKLLRSPMHEERGVALFVLVDRFERAKSEAVQEAVFDFYCCHLDRVNNWDLVDQSAPAIVGGYLETRDRAPLYRWARSKALWERRIAMLATFHYIKRDDFEDALGIAAILCDDPEDLIHKAVGWMLREIGKRDLATEESFLKPRYRNMPRTMLRYAIEKFPEKKRRAYLEGTV